jgi:hypothetical protein
MTESPCQDSLLLQIQNRRVQQLQSGAKSKTNQHHPLGRMCVNRLSFELTYNESVQPSIGRVANLFKWVTHSRLLFSQFPSQGHETWLLWHYRHCTLRKRCCIRSPWFSLLSSSALNFYGEWKKREESRPGFITLPFRGFRERGKELASEHSTLAKWKWKLPLIPKRRNLFSRPHQFPSLSSLFPCSSKEAWPPTWIYAGLEGLRNSRMNDNYDDTIGAAG